MKFNKKEIGNRIREAREKKKMRSVAALARTLQQVSNSGLTRQTVQNWEAGKIIPPWDKVEFLAEVFGPEFGEDWIMFGPRRTDQLAGEHPFLSYISLDEQEILNAYRHANGAGKKSIINTAKALAEANPISPAEIHLLRRKTDTPPKS